jgi:hypothetical protein
MLRLTAEFLQAAVTPISNITNHQRHNKPNREKGVQSPSLANKNTCQPNAANAMKFFIE